jgi:hypothetical protein
MSRELIESEIDTIIDVLEALGLLMSLCSHSFISKFQFIRPQRSLACGQQGIVVFFKLMLLLMTRHYRSVRGPYQNDT